MRYGDYKINILDTPGHADFGGEVERVLKMVDGVMLLVDAAEGCLPQTRFVLRKALEQRLPAIAVVNKIDLPAAQPEKVALEIQKVLGCRDDEILFVSGKTGAGVEELLDAVVARVPPPAHPGPR